MSGTIGNRVPRAERIEQIKALVADGCTHKQIGEKLGLSVSTVRTYIYDPDDSKNRARRERYGKQCRRCGTRTFGGDGAAKAPDICARCRAIEDHENRHWTPETIIAQIRRFAAENGRPPVATEWLTAGHGINGDGYPPVAVIQREFDSWANAIEAAGFERPRLGWKPRGVRPRGLQVSNEEYIQRIRDTATDGVAAGTDQAPEPHGAYTMLLRRGIGWDEACALAGVQPRRGSRK